MQKLTRTLTAAALVLSCMVLQANAQNQANGAATMRALAQNATPIATQAACRGVGPYCPPGFVRACNRWRCWCRPCM
jgi:hypothetical protein